MNMNESEISSKDVDIRNMTKEEKKEMLVKDIEETEGCLTITLNSKTEGSYSFMIIPTGIYHLYKTDEKFIPIESLGKFTNATEVADAIFTHIDEKEKGSKSDEYEYEQN